jgi:hypothetical protein
MALELLDCTNCGAHLPPPGNSRFFTCEFCRHSMLNPGYVPEAAPVAHAAPVAPVAPAAPAPVAQAPAPAPAAQPAPAAGPRARSAEELVSVARAALLLHDSLYYAPTVPPAKERNARAAYGAALPPTETIAVLYDGTVFGAGDDGFIVTPNFLGWNGGTPHLIPWRDIDPATVVVAKTEVSVMGQEIPLVPDELVDRLARLIREQVAFARPAPAPAAARPVAPPAKPVAAPVKPAASAAPAKPPLVAPGAPEWFAAIDGDQSGPHTPDELRKMVADGRIDGATLVWTVGAAGWKPIKEVEALAGVLPAARVPAKAAPVPVGPRRAASSPLLKGPRAAQKAAEPEAEESTDAAEDDAAALEIIQRFLRERGGLHVSPGIPAHAERTARGTHEDELPDDEAILALFLSDEGGFVVTSGSFYWHDGDGATASIDWEDFDTDDLSIEDDELYIEEDLVPTGNGQHSLSRQLRKTIEALCEWAQ